MNTKKILRGKLVNKVREYTPANFIVTNLHKGRRQTAKEIVGYINYAYHYAHAPLVQIDTLKLEQLGLGLVQPGLPRLPCSVPH